MKSPVRRFGTQNTIMTVKTHRSDSFNMGLTGTFSEDGEFNFKQRNID